MAVSKDGLHFKASEEVLGLFYFRVFRWQEAWFAMAKGGLLYRSKDGLTGFEQGPNPFPGSEARDASTTPRSAPRGAASCRRGALGLLQQHRRRARAHPAPPHPTHRRLETLDRFRAGGGAAPGDGLTRARVSR